MTTADGPVMVTHAVRERLYSRLVPDMETGCLLWTGGKNPDGYGTIRIGSVVRKIHRVAWELEYGPIAAGLQIDHVKARGCRYRHCGNIAHLKPVTQRQNIMRGDGIAAKRAAQTHCVNGHEFDLFNTLIDERGNRHCLECKRIRGREWMRRKRAERRASGQ